MAHIWDRRILSRLVLMTAALMPMTAMASDRNIGVTSFDSIRLEGPFRVEIATNRSPSAHITGDMRAIDAVTFTTNGTSLTIRQNSTNWGGMDNAPLGQAVIHLTTPMLRRVVVLGSGDLHIDRVKTQSLNVLVAGSGSIAIDDVDAVSLDGQVNGAGNLQLGGKTETTFLMMEGAGTIAANRLVTDHLKLRSNGNGHAELQATTTANVVMVGNGAVTIAGKAACNVDNKGSGTIACGKDVPMPVAPQPVKDEAAPLQTPSPAKANAVTRDATGVHIHRGQTSN